MSMQAAVATVMLVLGTAAAPAAPGCQQEAPASSADLHVWHEFVDLLQAGPFPGERIEPYREDLRAPLLGFLATMSRKADWKEWRREPDIARVGDRVHFLLPLTFDGETATYCFSFLTGKGTWHFQHLEAITLRLDRLGPLPATRFPDLPEPDKAYMREELEVSREVRLYNSLAAEKGADAALEWFKDGVGYALAARAWVPFVSPERAFILYLCWEEANLRGSQVSLVRLDDHEAEVRLKALYFEVYESAAHLKQQIPLGSYRRLFETIWQDRARNAGWKLDISYAGDQCVFRFTR